jgi:hypothetical protein
MELAGALRGGARRAIALHPGLRPFVEERTAAALPASPPGRALQSSGCSSELVLSLNRLQLLDELRWRRYALEHGGLNGRAAKRIALLDAEIARRETAYVATFAANGNGAYLGAAMPAPSTPPRASAAPGVPPPEVRAPTASPPARDPRRSRRRRTLRILPAPAPAGSR